MFDFAPILKIPLLLVFLACAHVSLTPPASASPPGAGEKAPSTSMEFLMNRGFATGLKVFATAVVLVEVLILSTTHIPELACFQPRVQGLLSFPPPTSPSPTPFPSSFHLLSTLISKACPQCTEHLASFSPSHPDLHALAPTIPFLLGLLLAILGASLRLAAYRHLGHMFTFEMSIRRDHKLITRGVYAWVRHPAYTGAVVFALGAGGCVASPGSWLRESGILHTPLGQAIVVPFPTLALCILIGMLRRMQKEDELLKETFGEEWEKWAGRVRWKLIPYVY